MILCISDAQEIFIIINVENGFVEKNSSYFKIEVFTVTFDQLNASLMNKNNYFLEKNFVNPNFNSSVY